MNEKTTKFKKIQEFLNDEDNGLIIRLGMVVIGIVLGVLLILLSSVFENPTISTTFLVFGLITFGSFLFASAIWYVNKFM